MNVKVNSFGTVSIILGIVTIVTFCVPGISVFLGGLGLLFGILSFVEAKRENEPTSKGLTGIILGILALLLALSMNIYYLNNWEKIFNNKNYDYFDDNYDDYYDDYNGIDTNYNDIDSMLLDDDQINDLNNSIDDENNGPGVPPE